MGVSKHFKSIYLSMLRDRAWAMTEKLSWAFPVSYKVSIYQEHEWFVGNAYGISGVPIPLPTEKPLKAFLLNSMVITELQVK